MLGLFLQAAAQLSFHDPRVNAGASQANTKPRSTPTRHTPLVRATRELPAKVAEPESRLVAALLADGRHQLIDATTGQQTAEYRVADYTVDGPEQLPLLTRDARRLLVLTHPRPGHPGRITLTSIELATGALTRHEFSGAEPEFRSMAIGHTSGRLYLTGFDANGVMVLEADPATLRSINQWRALSRPTAPDSTRPVILAAGPRWRPITSSIDLREQRLCVSFHGGNAGAEWFSLVSRDSLGCPRPAAPDKTCLQNHGAIQALKLGVVMANGDEVITILRPNGVLDSIDTGLKGNHLMGFSVDSAERRLAAVGPCYHTGGLAIVELAASGSAGVRTQQIPSVCGDRLSLSRDGSWIAVAGQLPAPARTPAVYGLRFLGATDSKEWGSLALPVPAVDVVILDR